MSDFEFDAACSEFTLANALGCARASLLAYEKNVDLLKETARGWGFANCEPLTRKNHFGFVAGNADVVLVVFRGTDEGADWWTNLNVLFKQSPLGLVHRGFMTAAELFWPDLPQWISKFRDRDQPVWISGHSLGGALAVLAAAKLVGGDELEVAGLYTFGQPPVGTLGFCRKFKERFANRFFRFVNHTDAVADLPILFRAHVGEVRYFDTSGALWLREPPWRVSALDHMRAPGKYGGLAEFAAHSMRNYVELLERQLTAEVGHEARRQP